MPLVREKHEKRSKNPDLQPVLEAFYRSKKRIESGMDWRGKTMKVDRKYLKSLRPCADRFENYLKHYGDWSGSLSEFLDLENITHRDKVWVFVRSIPTESKQAFAIDMAESVLHLFEAKYPNDKRPQEAITAAKLVLKGSLSKDAAATYAAHADRAAAYAADAAYDAAYAAAHAAHAAADAADAAAHAAHAAAHAAYDAAYAADAAYDAAYAAAHAADADAKTINEQLDVMKKYAESNNENV